MIVSPFYLSLWEVAHRWHDKHPNETDPRVIPMDVLDTLRWLAKEAIRHNIHLCNEHGVVKQNCNDAREYEDYLGSEDLEGDSDEKWEEYLSYRENICQRHEKLIVGFEPCPIKRNCPKEVFDNVFITRHSLQEFCDEQGVEAPSFWPYSTRVEEEEKTPDKPLRPSTQDKVTVQAVAKALWDEDPNLTIAALLRHKAVQIYAGARNYSAEKTVRPWLSEVDPRGKEQKTGRPKKQENQ